MQSTFAPRSPAGWLVVLSLFIVACSCGFRNPLARAVTPTVNPAFTGVELGEVVMAGQIGPGNAPLDVRYNFATTEPVIYVVARANRVETGASFFARWFIDGEPLEDTPVITAGQQYTDTYIEFHIQPVSGAFAPGKYSVQLFINGAAGPEVEFSVQ